MEYYGYQMVPVDFFRFHYLVYDAAYTKIGSLDYKRGVWTFTHVNTGETWFGLTRTEALRSWLIDPDRKVASVIARVGPVQALKGTS